SAILLPRRRGAAGGSSSPAATPPPTPHHRPKQTSTTGQANCRGPRIAEFVARFKHEEVSELFFYFTGHGEFVDDEFRFLLKDYQKQKPSQTSISNSELDNYLRSLSPELVVKVVDACYSGTPYLKDGSSFSDYMKATTEKRFSKCYFFFSSQSDQRSWASEHISDFTQAFVGAVAESPLESVRYADVIDSLSDAFLATARQRPLFVVQSDFTEVFGTFSEEVRARLKSRIQRLASVSESFPASAKSSLAALVRAKSGEFVSMQEAIEAVQRLMDDLKGVDLGEDISDLFEINLRFQPDFVDVPKAVALGKWVSESGMGFFASPTFREEEIEIDDSMNRLLSITTLGKSLKRTRSVITGLETKIPSLPFCACLVLLNPKLPNLTQYGGWLTFLLSKTTLQAFFCAVEYKEVNWGEYKRLHITDWSPMSAPLASFDGASIVEPFSKELRSFVETKVRARLAGDAEGVKGD
ncbi:caspase family protein, partial [Caballeronia sp. ATUFL_M1_KS5A]|uniref:caspase family protein n=1 Tax=Caballeronia sp. ATUFL_M1_KS5A TaxID=2921778 RepID=UPI0020281BC2